MFHRSVGKIMFPILVVVFLLLSIQNTWAFLQDAMPGDTLLYKALAMVVFEGGFIGWLSLTMHGAENVLRTILSGLMTLITGAGVFTAATFEIGRQMQGIGFQLSPQFMLWIPVIVLGSFIATGASCALYLLASPEFFARMSFMNATGQEPPIGTRIEMMRPHANEPLALSRPRQATPRQIGAPVAQARPARVGLLNRVQNWLNDRADARANEQAEEAEDQPAAQGDGVQSDRLAGGLDFIGKKMLERFQQASAAEQAELVDMARNMTTSEVVGALQTRYPSYARHITEDRVRAVMAAYLAEQAEPEPVMQQSAAARPRAASARTRQASGSSRAKASTRRDASELASLLTILETAQPGASVAQIARLAGVDESTVRRYRQQRSQQGGN